MRTFEQVAAWVGRDALDADGKLVGVVAAVRRDGVGAASSLEIEADGGVLALPLDGCEEAGTAIRLPIADGAHAAPPRPAGSPSPAGGPAPEQLGQIVARLREAYSLEGEGIARLELLSFIIEDTEIQHDATLHADETRNHRTGVEERLRALEKTPSHLRDLGHAARAAVAGLRDRLSGDPVAALRDAVEFERREAAFYGELEQLARAAGDTATADLAAAHRADELAAADGFEASIPRIDSPA